MITQEASSSSLLEAAIDYRQAGLCVLPANRERKRPLLPEWKSYQSRLPTDTELPSWFSDSVDGICIVAGPVSGNLEMIDFDCGGELFPAWKALIPPELYSKLVIETSQCLGQHVVYRCEGAVSGNLKLAQRNIDNGVVTLIETRGTGGLFLCAPTPGYELVQGQLSSLPVLSSDERETLLSAARELNESRPVTPDTTACAAHFSVGVSGRPGDDFNARGDVAALLLAHGWKPRSTTSDDNQHWTRPGKEDGTSATLKERIFYVFSSNAHPLEPNRAYSPFALYVMLEHAGDFEAAASTLAAEGFGEPSPEDSDVDLSGIVGVGETSCDDEAPPTISDPGPLPEDWIRIPGFISEVMDHCLETAPYPNPVMAFCGALSLQAFLAGRKVRDPGDNRTNLYLLGLAHSAAGKDWPRKVNVRILHEVGLADCLGERFASGEGIQDALFLSPSMLFQTDEIDGLLQTINKAKDARHENVMSTLLTLYSSSNSVFPMRRKAGKESPGVIDQPSLVIFGTAIPNHYYDALSERMLTNGFFARMLIVECGRRGSGQEPKICKIPDRIINTATWWRDFQPGSGNLGDWHPVPAIVQHSQAAKEVLIEARREAELEYEAAESKNDVVGTTVWGRVNEQIRKLSLIYAISENHTEPAIGRKAADWAVDVVMHQTRRMLFMAEGHVASNDFDAMCKQMLRVLRGWKRQHGDEPMPEWQLNRRLPWKPKDHQDVTAALVNQERISFEIETTKTRPRRIYKLL